MCCSKCSFDNPAGVSFCGNCGHELSKRAARVLGVKSKDRGTTLVLAILLGLFGFYGMGHIYLGRAARGVAFLLTDWAVSIVGVVFMFTAILWPVGVMFFLVSVGLFFWQILDADSLVRHYNKVLEETGNVPW